MTHSAWRTPRKSDAIKSKLSSLCHLFLLLIFWKKTDSLHFSTCVCVCVCICNYADVPHSLLLFTLQNVQPCSITALHGTNIQLTYSRNLLLNQTVRVLNKCTEYKCKSYRIRNISKKKLPLNMIIAVSVCSFMIFKVEKKKTLNEHLINIDQN